MVFRNSWSMCLDLALFTLVVPNSSCHCSWDPLCTGIVLNLMHCLLLLRGGKTWKREFCKIFKSWFLSLPMLFVFLNVYNFSLIYLFCCRCRSEIRCVWDTSLDLVRMVGYAIFVNVLENRCMDAICYWLSGILFLLPWDIRFSTNEGVYLPVYSKYVEGSWSLRMLMCVWGNVCSLSVRGLSRRRH